MLVDPKAPTLDAILMADPTFASWAKIPSNDVELKKLQLDGIVVQAKTEVSGAEVKWIGNTINTAYTMGDWGAACFAVKETGSEKDLIVPAGKEAIVGRDGIFCKPNR